jgi:transcriptional regulator with XRE-family HTH domain
MGTVSEDLRDALERCGQTRYAVSKATGISQAVLSRFVHGKPLRGDNTDTLAAYLGLELRQVRQTRKAKEWQA